MIFDSLVNRLGLYQLEEGGFGFELGTISPLHLESTGHRTEGRRQRAARRVFKGLSRLENRLFADDARTVDLLRMTRAVHDRPMPVQQLDGRVTDIRDSNRIEKKPTTSGRIAVFRREARTDLDADTRGFGFGARLEEVGFGHPLDISSPGRFGGSALRR